MAGLNETDEWADEVYQIEMSDPVVGGTPNEATGAGMSNIPHLQLAKRTKWLKSKVDTLISQVVDASSAVAGIVKLSTATNSSSTTTAATPSAVKAAYDNAETRALKATTISVTGLASGGGDLSGNRTIAVLAASDAEAVAGTINTKSMTPYTTAQAINAALNGLLDGAPGALDTLNELAAALGDDPNFASTILSKLAIASPAGLIAPFAFSAPPSGWLECDGSAISRTSYAALFTAIGTSFGAGDGSTTFSLPDLRGEFIRGWDNGRGVDAGRTFGSFQDHALQSHQHLFKSPVPGTDTDRGGESSLFSIDGSISALTDWGVNANFANETRPRNVALMYCIKY